MLISCKPGEKYRGTVLIADWKENPFRNKPGTFVVLTCQDKSGQMEGKIWEVDHLLLTKLNDYDVFAIEATVNEFRGNVELLIDKLQPLEESEIDLDELMPASPYSLQELEERLNHLMSLIEIPEIKTLLLNILNNPKLGGAYRKAPAALKVHHAYLRGLFEHSLGVAELALSLYPQYPEVNRDTLLAGALLHDLGKIMEYGYDRTITHTTDGRLLGHIIMGVDLLSREMAQIEGFPDPLRSRLLHILTSHHGRYEWQSPKRPKCMEAVIVHYADALETELWQFRQFKKDNPEEPWSPYVRTMERYLFLD